MADSATTDPADQDPISQTFTAGNALNAKTFIDTQLQYNNMMLANNIQIQSQLQQYSLQAMARAEAMNNQAMAMVTAVNTKAAKTLLDETSDALADAIVGQQGVKAAQTTPPDTSTLSTLVQQLAALLSGLTAVSNQATTTTTKA